MRSKKEILAEAESIIDKDWANAGSTADDFSLLILEVCLDIREILRRKNESKG